MLAKIIRRSFTAAGIPVIYVIATAKISRRTRTAVRTIFARNGIGLSTKRPICRISIATGPYQGILLTLTELSAFPVGPEQVKEYS